MVFLRIAGAALLLLVPTVRALDGRWHLLRREWGQVVAFGLLAVALPQLAFFYAVGHLSVGVALMLEYLGLVLVVAWQAVLGRRLPRAADRARRRAGAGRAGAGARRPRLGGGARSTASAWRGACSRRVGLASYFLMSGSTHETALPPLALAGGGLVVGAVAFAVLGRHRRAADGVPRPPRRS